MTKEKFLKAYPNLPVPEREQIIVVLDDEPYSWNVSHKAILDGTDLGKKILKKLEELDIL